MLLISNRRSYSKKRFGSGLNALIISKDEMDDIIKIVITLQNLVY